MVRNRLVLPLLILALSPASLPLRAEEQPAQSKPLVLPNTALALPVGCSVKARWVSPPLDPKTVESASWYDLCFAVDASGRPWIGYQDDSIISPVRQYRFELPQRYTSLGCTESGGLLVATGSDLCFVAPPKKLESTYDKIPTAVYQPVVNLPVPKCKLFTGDGNCVYLVSTRSDGGSDVYLFWPDGLGAQGFVKVLSTKLEVSAVTGDGGNVFVAMGQVIVKTTADHAVTKVYANPREYIRGLVYLPGTGLFYCTSSGIGCVGAKGDIPLMSAPDASIALQKGTLYVLFSKSLGVLALDNIQDLKRFDRPVKQIPVTESKDVKLTSVRLFEAGKDAPEYAERQYATTFGYRTTRYVYCQADIENLQYGKLRHRQTFTMELHRAGRDDRLESQDIVFDCNPDFSTMWGWARFGSETPCGIYPGDYTVKTYLNGTLVNESKFAVRGEPSLLEASSNHDLATVKKLIGVGTDVNATTSSGYTPLMLAALTHDAGIVKALLDAHADVKLKASDGETALTADGETWQDDPGIVKLLLAAGADPDAAGKDGATALHKSVSKGKIAVTKALLERGARTDVKNEDGLTPLMVSHISYTYGAEATARLTELLLASGASAEDRDASGKPVLFAAVEGRNPDVVAALIRHGADVNATSKIYGTERSVLGYLLEEYKVFRRYRLDRSNLRTIASMLQEKGADLNVSEFERAYFSGIDEVLDRRHVARLLEMSEGAANACQPEDPQLRKADLRGLLNAACREISKAGDTYGYYGALNLCEEAGSRARKWGLISSCPEISYNMGLIYVHVGSTDNARKYLQEYLDLAPAGSCAASARELIGKLK